NVCDGDACPDGVCRSGCTCDFNVAQRKDTCFYPQ
uniref:Turripeptide Pal9a n=1 Tax=Polystira albida TaxID=394106 RepID=VPL9A_POLAB|nr:RecName: Full=Turripeptide Pal9a [Polystira albida]